MIWWGALKDRSQGQRSPDDEYDSPSTQVYSIFGLKCTWTGSLLVLLILLSTEAVVSITSSHWIRYIEVLAWRDAWQFWDTVSWISMSILQNVYTSSTLLWWTGCVRLKHSHQWHVMFMGEIKTIHQWARWMFKYRPYRIAENEIGKQVPSIIDQLWGTCSYVLMPPKAPARLEAFTTILDPANIVRENNDLIMQSKLSMPPQGDSLSI